MQSKHVKTILNLLLYVSGILLVCFLLPRLIRFFMPFVIGMVFALIANPLVKFFEKRLKIMRKHGSWVVIVGVLALVITAFYFLVSWLVREGIGFLEYLPGMYESVTEGFDHIGNNINLWMKRLNLPVEMNGGLSEILTNFDVYIGNIIGTLGAPTLSVAGDIVGYLPTLLVQSVFMFLSAYFFIADRERISECVKKIMPKVLMERWAWLKKLFSQAVGGYFKAQFKIMGIIAAILFVGFLILRVEYAILWALLLAFLDLLPFLGTGTAIWPWAAFQLMTGDYSMAVGLMIIYLVCLLVHQLLQPKFVGDTVGMDPLTTLIFMFIGYRFSSVLGMILAVPVGIIVMNLYKAGAFDKLMSDLKELVNDFNEYRNS